MPTVNVIVLISAIALTACKNEQFGSNGLRTGVNNTKQTEVPEVTGPGVPSAPGFYGPNSPNSGMNEALTNLNNDESKTFANAGGFNIEKFKITPTSADSDIAFVIDMSASMGGEVGKVQSNITSFATRLAQDPRTSGYQLFILAGKNDHRFNPPASVASNPNFTFEGTNHSIGSHNALTVAQDFLSGKITTPKIALRPSAKKHIIFVTDDDAGAAREVAMRQYLAANPKLVVHFHGIVCPKRGSGCETRGNEYYNLAGDPKYAGVTHDLRTSNWSPIFDGIASNITTNSDYSLALSMPVKGNIDVFANGAKLAPSAYQYANGKIIVFKNSVPANATIIVVY